MAFILEMAAFVYGFSNMGHVLPMQENFVKPKIVSHEFFLHNHNLKMQFNNILVGIFLLQNTLGIRFGMMFLH